jgi:predicted phosphodiesterase
MRFAVLSDIHGNRVALEAVLADIDRLGVDAVLNLGDMLSGPLDPSGVADLLIERNFPSIGGNHDRYLVEGDAASLGTVDRFVRSQLSLGQFEWLRHLPKTAVFGGEVFLCHGTPGSDEVPWLDSWMEGRLAMQPDEAAVAPEAKGIDYPVLLCGHTHIPRAVRLLDGRLIVNPGSVGLQMNVGLPWARYAIIQRRRCDWSIDFKAVSYDWEAAARQASANGFAHWAEALVTGWAPATGLF